MTRALKPLADQVVVITGATSGIGLATARAAAGKGAALILAARNEEALRGLTAELRAAGARCDYVVADVSDPAQVRAIADKARALFGGFDTWINDAAAAMYGRIADTPLEDQRQLFDTTYWGVVHGSMTAADAWKDRGTGSALINIGSVLSDYPIPIQGVYSAAKHAVKGFTNALRMELMRSSPHISVTLIKPSAIDTPYKDHARNLTGHPATNPMPVYDPALVAGAILYASEHRIREITVGGGGRGLALFGQLLPGLADPLYAWVVPLLHRDRAANHPHDTDKLDGPGQDLSERTATYPLVRRTSLYTQAQMNPQVTAVALFALGMTLAITLKGREALKIARIKGRVRAHEREKHLAREAKAAARRGT